MENQTDQPKAKMPTLYVVILVLVILAGGIFVLNQQKSAPTEDAKNESAMMEEEDSMMEENKDDAMMEETDKMMEGEDTMMAKEVEFDVEGGKFYYKPNVLKVKKGQLVQISFENKDGFHDFVIDEFDVASPQINGGQETDIEFVPDKVGEFEFYCSVGNHREMGMVGTLVVEE